MSKAINSSDNEPAVIGAGFGLSPMPTQEQRRRAWGDLFVHAAVKTGVLDQGRAEELFQSAIDEWDYDMEPSDALKEEMSYWDDDGDNE